jgi:hypothetical protein
MVKTVKVIKLMRHSPLLLAVLSVLVVTSTANGVKWG